MTVFLRSIYKEGACLKGRRPGNTTRERSRNGCNGTSKFGIVTMMSPLLDNAGAGILRQAFCCDVWGCLPGDLSDHFLPLQRFL